MPPMSGRLPRQPAACRWGSRFWRSAPWRFAISLVGSTAGGWSRFLSPVPGTFESEGVESVMGPMSRTMVNLVLDTTLLVTFIALVWCSVVLRFVFPPGPNANGWTLWSFDYDQWSGIQFGLVAVLTLGFLVHVMLHWSWVCGVLASRLSRDKKKVDEGIQTLYGVGLLIVLLSAIGVGVGAAVLSIHSPY